jgi:hypothetical protein
MDFDSESRWEFNSIDSKQFTEFQPRSAEPDGFGSTLRLSRSPFIRLR